MILSTAFNRACFSFSLIFFDDVINSGTSVHQFLDFFTDNTLGNIQSIQDFVNSFQQSLSQLFLDSVNNFTVSICQSSFMSEFIEEFEDFLFQFIDFHFSFDNQVFNFLSQLDVDNIKGVQNFISSF